VGITVGVSVAFLFAVFRFFGLIGNLSEKQSQAMTLLFVGLSLVTYLAVLVQQFQRPRGDEC
jgi:hypothetical protein